MNLFFLWFIILFVNPKNSFGKFTESQRKLLDKKFSALRDQLNLSEFNNNSTRLLQIDNDKREILNPPKFSSRNIRAACDNGKGNYGINSFNFMAFVLLTYNVVANVNVSVIFFIYFFLYVVEKLVINLMFFLSSMQ